MLTAFSVAIALASSLMYVAAARRRAQALVSQRRNARRDWD
jgi:hypothetical protein